MKRGSGSKQKGSAFERTVCRSLSLWVSGGRNEDLFWRSAMSGGRATVARKRGVTLSRQAGDISAVAPEGHALTDSFYIECKAYKRLAFDRFLIGSGTLYNFWLIACREATAHGRQPMLIVRENNFPVMLVLPRGQMASLGQGRISAVAVLPKFDAVIYRFDEVLATCFHRPKVKRKRQPAKVKS